MPHRNRLFKAAFCCALALASASAVAQVIPTLTWITNSSTKVEQIIGDVDWATGSNVTSRTSSRFHIEGTQNGASFACGTNLIFLFGDTFSDNKSIWKYDAADPLAWSTNTDGETPLF